MFVLNRPPNFKWFCSCFIMFILDPPVINYGRDGIWKSPTVSMNHFFCGKTPIHGNKKPIAICDYIVEVKCHLFVSPIFRQARVGVKHLPDLPAQMPMPMGKWRLIRARWPGQCQQWAGGCSNVSTHGSRYPSQKPKTEGKNTLGTWKIRVKHDRNTILEMCFGMILCIVTQSWMYHESCIERVCSTYKICVYIHHIHIIIWLNKCWSYPNIYQQTSNKINDTLGLRRFYVCKYIYTYLEGSHRSMRWCSLGRMKGGSAQVPAARCVGIVARTWRGPGRSFWTLNKSLLDSPSPWCSQFLTKRVDTLVMPGEDDHTRCGNQPWQWKILHL
jgi:hypothetical protein